MDNTFWGIPLIVWAILCLGVATLYYFLWPKPKAGRPPRPMWMHLVLRWFHSLVWVLLALACFLAMGEQVSMAGVVARLAILAYLIFIIAVAVDRRAGQQPVS